MIGWLDSISYYTAFTEGWALYAENPLISNDTDVYDEEPMRKYGMLKWQASITLEQHLSFVAASQPAFQFAFYVPRQFLKMLFLAPCRKALVLVRRQIARTLYFFLFLKLNV